MRWNRPAAVALAVGGALAAAMLVSPVPATALDRAVTCVDLATRGAPTTTALALPPASAWSVSWTGRFSAPTSPDAAALFRLSGPAPVLVAVIGGRVSAQVSTAERSAIVFTDGVAADPGRDADLHRFVLEVTQESAEVSVAISSDGMVAEGDFPGRASAAGSASVPTAVQFGTGTTAGITPGTSLVIGALTIRAGGATASVSASDPTRAVRVKGCS